MGVLSQMLASSMKSTMADDQGSWRQFVLDHLDYIQKYTKPSDIDTILMNQYRYDLPRFLKEKLGIQNDIAWIVLLLNNLSSDLEFVNPGIYIIPNDELITKLYHSYTTIETNKT